jgi:hypothetical protein
MSVAAMALRTPANGATPNAQAVLTSMENLHDVMPHAPASTPAETEYGEPENLATNPDNFPTDAGVNYAPPAAPASQIFAAMALLTHSKIAMATKV